jgi:hypothetical protein
MTVLEQARWNVTRADKATGGIEIHTTMELLTWTETFYVNLIKTGDNSTRVVMGRVGLAQPLDWGIARQSIEQFLLKLEPALRRADAAASETR